MKYVTLPHCCFTPIVPELLCVHVRVRTRARVRVCVRTRACVHASLCIYSFATIALVQLLISFPLTFRFMKPNSKSKLHGQVHSPKKEKKYRLTLSHCNETNKAWKQTLSPKHSGYMINLPKHLIMHLYTINLCLVVRHI